MLAHKTIFCSDGNHDNNSGNFWLGHTRKRGSLLTWLSHWAYFGLRLSLYPPPTLGFSSWALHWESSQRFPLGKLLFIEEWRGTLVDWAEAEAEVEAENAKCRVAPQTHQERQTSLFGASCRLQPLDGGVWRMNESWLSLVWLLVVVVAVFTSPSREEPKFSICRIHARAHSGANCEWARTNKTTVGFGVQFGQFSCWWRQKVEPNCARPHSEEKKRRREEAGKSGYWLANDACKWSCGLMGANQNKHNCQARVQPSAVAPSASTSRSIDLSLDLETRLLLSAFRWRFGIRAANTTQHNKWTTKASVGFSLAAH